MESRFMVNPLQCIISALCSASFMLLAIVLLFLPRYISALVFFCFFYFSPLSPFKKALSLSSTRKPCVLPDLVFAPRNSCGVILQKSAFAIPGYSIPITAKEPALYTCIFLHSLWTMQRDSR